MIQSKKIISGLCWMILLLQVTVTAQTVTIDLNTEYQSITGFGGINMPGWINDLTEDQAAKAFGNEPGQLGLTIMRMRVPNDTTQFFREVPTAVRAKNYGALLFASPWSPPAYMKSNNNIVDGYLLPENYDIFADHLLSFAAYMSENGAALDAVSLQNEPDVQVSYESCDWTPAEMISFLEEQGPRVDTLNIIVAESYNFNRTKTDPILNDAEAEPYIGIIGGHIYGGGLFDYPLAREKGKEVWMTEHFTESAHSANDWPLALDVASEINSCMKVNFNAYVWWYLRRYYGPIDDAGNITKRGYIMSQFSKFIRPGAVRVDAVPASAPNVSVSAFKTDSSLVIVAVNRSAVPVVLDFDIQNGNFDTITQYTTSAVKNVLNDGNIPIQAGSFQATIDANSITTFSTVTENAGRYGNIPPVAVAGSDLEMIDADNNGIEAVLLDGTASNDPDGVITGYSWSVDGVQIAWDTTYALNVPIGNHTAILAVTDNDGAVTIDTISIIVNSLFETNLWFEAECGIVGSTWEVFADAEASNGEYVMAPAGIESLEAASADTADLIIIPFYLPETGSYKLWGRVITPTANDDSYWIRIDAGTWALWNSIPAGSTWHWDDVHDQNSGNEAVVYELEQGNHQLEICFREDGAQLDKFYLTNAGLTPDGQGETDTSCPGEPIWLEDAITLNTVSVFPNPAHSEVEISWQSAFTQLVLYDNQGRELERKEYAIPQQRVIIPLSYDAGIYHVFVKNSSEYGMTRLAVR